jgi:hypothetical protein
MPKKLITVEHRTLYDIVSSSGELVGIHEDRDVALLEVDRLDQEATAHFAAAVGSTPGIEPVTHSIVVREISATSDQDDGLPNLEGPIVSDGEITEHNFERGEKSDEPVQRID